jgi:hypothetical protein
MRLPVVPSIQTVSRDFTEVVQYYGRSSYSFGDETVATGVIDARDGQERRQRGSTVAASRRFGGRSRETAIEADRFSENEELTPPDPPNMRVR